LVFRKANVSLTFKAKEFEEGDRWNGLTAHQIAEKEGFRDIVTLFATREEAKITILEMLCVTKNYLPKELRDLIVQIMILIFWQNNQLQQNHSHQLDTHQFYTKKKASNCIVM